MATCKTDDKVSILPFLNKNGVETSETTTFLRFTTSIQSIAEAEKCTRKKNSFIYLIQRGHLNTCIDNSLVHEMGLCYC